MGEFCFERQGDGTPVGRPTRRRFLQRAAALGLATPAVAAALAPTGSASARASQGTPGASASANPLGVDPAAPLDVVIFDGGYGHDYATYVDDLYLKLYPQAKITFLATFDISSAVGPRLAAGNPPDVVDNSGGHQIPNAQLVAAGELADLGDLLAAAAYDTPGQSVADTIVPGSQASGVFDGVQRFLNLALTVFGVWYSDAFMQAKGYAYPQTWDAMLDLCAELQAAGTAPWVTTGFNPAYIRSFVFDQLLYKHDPQAAIAIDNLAPDAWRAPAIAEVLESLYQLADRGYLAPGWAHRDYIQAQAEWLQGKAVFLPCGSWLENEMQDVTPPGFDMVVAPTPSLPGDKLPFAAINATGAESFIVPSRAKNVPGGKEWLRLLFSREGGRSFTEKTRTLSVVQGAAEGLDLGTAFASTRAVIAAAGANAFPSASYVSWYPYLEYTASDRMGALLKKQIAIAEFVDAVQQAADAVKDDDAIPKYHRPTELATPGA